MTEELIGLFDTHAHPTDERFNEDREQVLARMREAGMLCMCVGADMASSAQSVALANENENIYAAVGVHPHDAKDFTEADIPQLTRWLTQEKKVKALGEIGLDYAVTGDSVLRTAQRHWFEQQMELAADRSLPVIIHCVRAYNDLIPILRHYPHVTPVIHGFTGSPELAERLLQAGGYLSFGHRTAASPKTRQALAAVPVDRVFFETDESPLPIAATYATAAAITGKTVAEWKETVYDNYRRLFKTL